MASAIPLRPRTHTERAPISSRTGPVIDARRRASVHRRPAAPLIRPIAPHGAPPAPVVPLGALATRAILPITPAPPSPLAAAATDALLEVAKDVAARVPTAPRATLPRGVAPLATGPVPVPKAVTRAGPGDEARVAIPAPGVAPPNGEARPPRAPHRHGKAYGSGSRPPPHGRTLLGGGGIALLPRSSSYTGRPRQQYTHAPAMGLATAGTGLRRARQCVRRPCVSARPSIGLVATWRRC